MQRRREDEKNNDWSSASKSDNVPEWIMDRYGDAKKQLSAVTGSLESGV